MSFFPKQPSSRVGVTQTIAYDSSVAITNAFGHRGNALGHGDGLMDGVLIRAHLDSNGEDLAIEHVQDVEPILRWNREARRDEQRSEWGRHVARIPNVIYVKWLNEEHGRGHTSLRMFTPEFDLVVQRKLDDPEWAYLRTDRPKLQAGWSARQS